jgi:hypothetical protein
MAISVNALKDRGCGRLVLTGSVFEANKGASSAPLAPSAPMDSTSA